LSFFAEKFETPTWRVPLMGKWQVGREGIEPPASERTCFTDTRSQPISASDPRFLTTSTPMENTLRKPGDSSLNGCTFQDGSGRQDSNLRSLAPGQGSCPTSLRRLHDDYSAIYGIGIGVNFDYQGGSDSGPGGYDATSQNVVGLQFTLASEGVFPPFLRVEFPTTDTIASTDDAYDVSPTASGTYQVFWKRDLETPFPPVLNKNISYTPTDGGLGAQPAFNPAHLVSMQIHVPTNASSAVPVKNLCVGNLSAIVSQ
jgi:hypothetical protein